MRNDSSITSKRNVTLKKTSRTVEFGNDPVCETIQNKQANEPVKLPHREDEIMMIN